MATEKTQKTVIRPGDFVQVPFENVKSATDVIPQLGSERDEYVSIWERMYFDKDAKMTLKKDVYDKLTEMYLDIKENFIRVPTQGFLRKDGNFYLISGRQRRGLVEVARKREQLFLDRPFPVCVIKEDDVSKLLASQFIINDKNVDESYMSIAAYVRGFRGMGKKNKEIASLLKVSEMWISKVARVDESPYLASLVKDDIISLDTCADQFAQKDFLDAFRDPTSKKIDEDKLKAKVQPILDEMVSKGLALSRNAVRAHMKRIDSPDAGKGTPKSAFSRDDLKKMFAAEVGISIPLPFKLFIGALLGKERHSKSEILAVCKDLEWIKTIDFRSKKEILADKRRIAALNAANEQKEMDKLTNPPTVKGDVAEIERTHPDAHDDDDESDGELNSWEYEDEQES